MCCLFVHLVCQAPRQARSTPKALQSHLKYMMNSTVSLPVQAAWPARAGLVHSGGSQFRSGGAHAFTPCAFASIAGVARPALATGLRQPPSPPARPRITALRIGRSPARAACSVSAACCPAAGGLVCAMLSRGGSSAAAYAAACGRTCDAAGGAAGIAAAAGHAADAGRLAEWTVASSRLVWCLRPAAAGTSSMWNSMPYSSSRGSGGSRLRPCSALASGLLSGSSAGARATTSQQMQQAHPAGAACCQPPRCRPQHALREPDS
jgi:hypothetical protein